MIGSVWVIRHGLIGRGKAEGCLSCYARGVHRTRVRVISLRRRRHGGSLVRVLHLHLRSRIGVGRCVRSLLGAYGSLWCYDGDFPGSSWKVPRVRSAARVNSHEGITCVVWEGRALPVASVSRSWRGARGDQAKVTSRNLAVQSRSCVD